MKDSKGITFAFLSVGTVLKISMVTILLMINNRPNEITLFWNMIYLVFSRPLFMIGWSMCTLPLVIDCELLAPLKIFFSHDIWVPFSRLSYGAYLASPVFMYFKQFNSERGQWAC